MLLFIYKTTVIYMESLFFFFGVESSRRKIAYLQQINAKIKIKWKKFYIKNKKICDTKNDWNIISIPKKNVILLFNLFLANAFN